MVSVLCILSTCSVNMRDCMYIVLVEHAEDLLAHIGPSTCTCRCLIKIFFSFSGVVLTVTTKKYMYRLRVDTKSVLFLLHN